MAPSKSYWQDRSRVWRCGTERQHGPAKIPPRGIAKLGHYPIAAEFDRAMRYKVGRRDLAEAGNVLVEPHMHRAVIGQRVQFAHRLEITSLTFMLNWVPLPIIQTCRGNMS